MYYRNIIDIEHNGDIIEAGSLFTKSGKILTLVDEDRTAILHFNSEDFVVEDNPDIISEYKIVTPYFNSILMLKEALQETQSVGSWSISYDEVEYAFIFKSTLTERQVKVIICNIPYIRC
ncbi:hypothetical protein [Riemerella columbina]|uniref:hypothetical protein n=1 Tax=Riemerella columbina TaxID=103810 RepID=UPI000378334F|nr:hypothetical protein [Riemerella columbina]